MNFPILSTLIFLPLVSSFLFSYLEKKQTIIVQFIFLYLVYHLLPVVILMVFLIPILQVSI